jgi:uncharacterized protein Smg (DUF494 family)
MGEGLKEILKKLDMDEEGFMRMLVKNEILEENLRESIIDCIAEKYGLHELTAEIEDTVEEIFAKIKK